MDNLTRKIEYRQHLLPPELFNFMVTFNKYTETLQFKLKDTYDDINVLIPEGYQTIQSNIPFRYIQQI